MRFYAIGLAIAAGITLGGVAAAQNDNQLRDRIVRHSISQFRGQCPCPYHLTWSGRRCGDRAAYLQQRRPAGLLCYSRDVTAQMMQDFRGQRRN
jgi:hypothetical protein